MKRGVLITLLLIFLITPLILAVNTPINVITEPNADVTIRIQDPEYKKEFQVFKKTTDSNGETSAIFTEDQGKISVYVQVKKNGKIIESKRFDDFITGNPININFKEGTTPIDESEEKVVESDETEGEVDATVEIVDSEESTKETQETITTEEKTLAEETEKTKGITGAAITNLKSIATSRTTYYIVGGILVFIVLFCLIHFIRTNIPKKGFKITKLGERSYDKELADAERKLEIAKRELDDLKNRKTKLKEARERLKRDKEELRRLEE